MDRDYGMEIDGLKKDLAEVMNLLQELMRGNVGKRNEAGACGRTGADAGQKKAEDAREAERPDEADDNLANEAGDTTEKKYVGEVQMMSNMHPLPQISAEMEELCRVAGEKGCRGLVSYMGVFASGGRQSNWIKRTVDVDELLPLIENHTAEKVLRCIGNSDRLNILLAILKKPRTVAELVTVCGLNSTGQAYHHMKPLLAADLIAEDDAPGGAVKGVYVVRPHKVQGIIMLLAGIADMVDETYTKGDWDKLDE